MNTDFGRQSPKRTAPAPCTAFTADVWEEYAMGMRSEEDSASLEEHLLICSVCQDLLADADEYVQAVKAAADLLAAQHGEGKAPVTDSRTRRRLSKRAAAAATLA
jgi:predicted anti-sigma-YlaC factor YlaD